MGCEVYGPNFKNENLNIHANLALQYQISNYQQQRMVTKTK